MVSMFIRSQSIPQWQTTHISMKTLDLNWGPNFGLFLRITAFNIILSSFYMKIFYTSKVYGFLWSGRGSTFSTWYHCAIFCSMKVFPSIYEQFYGEFYSRIGLEKMKTTSNFAPDNSSALNQQIDLIFIFMCIKPVSML